MGPTTYQLGVGGPDPSSVNNAPVNASSSDMMMTTNQNEIANSNLMKGPASSNAGANQIMGGGQQGQAPHQRSTSLSGLQQVRMILKSKALIFVKNPDYIYR